MFGILEMDFHGMRRKELQALCKTNGIPANLTNLEMANRLTALIGEKEKPIAQQIRSCLKDTGELVRENDSDGVTKQSKKVRFSPENDMMEFEEFGYDYGSVQAKKGERRKTMTRSIAKKEKAAIENFDSVKPPREIVEVRRTRSRAQKFIDGGVNPVALPTVEKKWTRRGLKSGSMVVKDDDGGEKHYPIGDNSGNLVSESVATRETCTLTRRSARIRVRESSKEVEYVAASRKNPRQRSLKKQGVESTAESSGNNHIAADGEIARPERRLKRSRRNASKAEDCAVLNLDSGKGEMMGGVSNKCFGAELAGNSSAVGNKMGAEAKVELLGKLEVVLPLEETSRHPGRVGNNRKSVMPQIDEVEIDVGKVENEKELIHKNPTNLKENNERLDKNSCSQEPVAITEDLNSTTNIRKKKPQKRKDPILAESAVAEPPRRSTRNASRTDKAVLDAETCKVSYRREVPSRSKVPSAEVGLLAESTLAVKEPPSLDAQLHLIDVAEHSIDPSPNMKVLNSITSKKRKEFSGKSLEKQEVSAETSCFEEAKAPEMENSMEIPGSTSENSKNDIVENDALFSASSEVVEKLNIIMNVDKDQELQDNDSRLNLASNFSKSRDSDSKNLVKPVSEIDSNSFFYDSFTCAMPGDDGYSLVGQRGFVAEPSGIIDQGQEKKREENSATGKYMGLGSVVAHQEVDGRVSAPTDQTLVDLEDGDSLCEKNIPEVDGEGPLANSIEIIGLNGTSESVHQEAGEISAVNVSNSDRIIPAETHDKHKCEADRLAVAAEGQESSNCISRMLKIEVETHLNDNFSASKDQPDVDAGLSEPELEVADGASPLVSSGSKEISEDTNVEEKMGSNDYSLKKHHPAEDCTKSSDWRESLESTQVSNSGKLQGDFEEQGREIPDGGSLVAMKNEDMKLVASNQKLYQDGMHNGNEYGLVSWSQNRNGGLDTKTVVKLEPIDDLCKVSDVGISKNTSEAQDQSSVHQGGLEGQSTSQLVLSEDFKKQTPVSSKDAGLRHVSSPNYAAEDDKSSVLEVQNFLEAKEVCRFAEPNVDERVSEARTEPNGQLVMEKENEGTETKFLSNSKKIMEKGASAFMDRNKMSLISMRRDTDQSEDTAADIYSSKLPLLFDNDMISSLEHTPLKDVNENGQGDEFKTLFATPLDNVNTNQQEGYCGHKTEIDIANKLKGSIVSNLKNGNLIIGEVQEVNGFTENENTCDSEKVLEKGAGKSAAAGKRKSLISSMTVAESSLAVCNDLMSSFEHTPLKDDSKSGQRRELRMLVASLAKNVNPNKEEVCSHETEMDDVRMQGSSAISNKKNGSLNIGEKQQVDKLIESENFLRNFENIMENRMSKTITDRRKMSLVSSNMDAHKIEAPLLVHNDIIHSFKHTPAKDDKESEQGDELKTLFATPAGSINSNEEEGCSIETEMEDVRLQEVSNMSNLVTERLITEEPQKLLELKNNENETITYNENASGPAIEEVTDDKNLELEFSGTYKESDGLVFQVNAPEKVPNEKLLERSVEAVYPPIITEKRDIDKSWHSEETTEGNVISDIHAVVIDSDFQGSEAASYHKSHSAPDHKASDTDDKAISSSEVRLPVDNEMQEKGNTSSPHDLGSSLIALSTVAGAKADDESIEGDLPLKCRELATDEGAGLLLGVGLEDPGKCKDLENGKSDTGLADAPGKESNLSKEQIMGVLVGGTSKCTEGTNVLEQEQNQGSLAPIFDPANSGHLRKTAIRNSNPYISDILVDKDAKENVTLAIESHSYNVTDHRIGMAQEVDKFALRASHEFLSLDNENCKEIGETSVDATVTKLKIGEIKFEDHVSYRIGILEGNSNIKETNSDMEDASPGDYDNCLEHEKVVETSSLLNILDWKILYSYGYMMAGQIYESLPYEGGLSCSAEGRELTEADWFDDTGPTVSFPLTVICNEDRGNAPTSNISCDTDEPNIRRNGISSAELSKEQVGSNNVTPGDGISYLESNKCLCGNDPKSTNGDTDEVPSPLHNLNGTADIAGVSSEQVEKQNCRAKDYKSSELSLESDMFSNLEANMFKFEDSFSGDVMEENTNAILSGKQFGHHNHLLEVKVLGQNNRCSGNEPFEIEKSTVPIEVSEVVSIAKGREHATLEGENTANSVAEATELHDAASDTDCTTTNQMPQFTDSAADHGVAVGQVLTTLQPRSEMTELESPVPKAWEGDATTGQLIPTTTLQRKDARTNLVQATPAKNIVPDMKENVPSVKRDHLGSLTVKSTAQRRALGDLRNK